MRKGAKLKVSECARVVMTTDELLSACATDLAVFKDCFRLSSLDLVK